MRRPPESAGVVAYSARMDRTSIADLVRGIAPERIVELVEELSDAEVLAMIESLPRSDVSAVDPAEGGPADFAQRLDPLFRRTAHVDVLSDAIEQTVLEAQDGSGPGRLIVNMPPRVGKSYTSSLWTPAWFVERWPERSVILASHESTYAISWGRKVRDMLREHADSGRVQARVSRQIAAAGEWETTQGGGMLSRGIGGSITGRGGHLLLIDDPLKDFAAAHSSGVRESQWQWWLSTASTRLEPGAAVVLVMTRWHEDDLAGRLTSREHEGDPDEWRVLRIPALGEGMIEDTDDRIAPDALERSEGEPLVLASTDETPDEAATRWERIRRSVGPYVWAGMYQQRPSEPEGTILRRAWWSYYRRRGAELVRGDGSRVPLSSLRIVQSWDMSFKDASSSSYVVGQVWGALGDGDRFLLDQRRERLGFVETKRAMRELRAAWPATEATYVEDKANGPAIIADLKRELSGLLPVSPKGSKEARAWSVQGDLAAGSHYLPSPEDEPWVREFVQESADFPNGTHDDQVDAYTQAIDRLRRGQGEIGQPKGSKSSPGVRSLPTTRRSIRRG